MSVRAYGGGRLVHKIHQRGGADAEKSGGGVSAWGGLNFMVLKKPVT